MSVLSDHLVVVRGGGDLGSGVIWRLSRVGFPVMVLELERPLTVRRTVAFSTAVTEGRTSVDGIDAVRVPSLDEAQEALQHGHVPVLVSEGLPPFTHRPSVIVDARLAKRPLDTTIDQAAFVVGLGPGFVAGRHCHAVVETMRGHDLGRVIWEGTAVPDTGVPGEIGGSTTKRVLRSPRDGELSWSVSFGDAVWVGQQVGQVDGTPVEAGVAGTVRGLLSPGTVTKGLKVGDVDPRLEPGSIHRISDKSLAVGGGALEAILMWMRFADR